MVILPVHHCDLGIRPECLAEGQPAKSRAQHHDLRATLLLRVYLLNGSQGQAA
jgi:hypothetical protein